MHHKIVAAFLIALGLASGLAFQALAQKTDDKKDAAKSVAIPTNTFFKGAQANHYLAKERLLGAKVVNKDGQTVGTIDDLILTTGNQVEGVILSVGGFMGFSDKKIGVRIGALRVTTADGKTTVTLPLATKEMLGAVDAYKRSK
jgi:sporulation protein YlmC with PRC-barrel domain